VLTIMIILSPRVNYAVCKCKSIVSLIMFIEVPDSGKDITWLAIAHLVWHTGKTQYGLRRAPGATSHRTRDAGRSNTGFRAACQRVGQAKGPAAQVALGDKSRRFSRRLAT